MLQGCSERELASTKSGEQRVCRDTAYGKLKHDACHKMHDARLNAQLDILIYGAGQQQNPYPECTSVPIEKDTEQNHNRRNAKQ